MIGNDIVDLEFSRKESNWQRKGLFDKICTVSEKSLIQNSENQEIMFWRLWSAKEAAYKIWNRKTGEQAFNPKFFECFDVNASEGKVKFGNSIFWSKTQITKSFIHTIVAQEKSDLRKISFLKNRDFIKKINQLPYFVGDNHELNPNISISNHGDFEKIIVLKSESGF